MIIRKAADQDLNAIIDVNVKAFGENDQEIATLIKEAHVDPSARPILSLLAWEKDQAIGHILFTKAKLVESENLVSIYLLAPLAVVPEFQSKGVGQKLIQEGLNLLSKEGVELVFVLGHPGYYPKAGFTPAGVLGFDAPYPIPEKDAGAWMVQELRSDAIVEFSGKIKCCDSIDKPEYWRE